MREPEEIRPFTISVPDGDIVDLRERLARVRWPPGPAGETGRYGVSGARVRELAEYWRDEYDWRTWEERLNRYPQFRTMIDGTTVHFLHVRSPEPGALPLILSHGWPGRWSSFWT